MNIIILRSACLLLLASLFAACRIEGGVPPATPVADNAPVSLPTVPPSPSPEPRQGWAIGLLQNEPTDLLPYHSSPADARATAPVSELIFPAPLLSVGYNYTTTGVLESVPTLENGGAQLQPIEVFLDPAGNITTTTTEVISQFQQIVVTYRWNPELRWSDGRPLTAADSVFAYELARTNARDGETRARLAAIERYEAVDEHTTRAVLRPDVIEPTYMTEVWTPLPRHLLEKLSPAEVLNGDFARQPVGYGPYAVARRSDGAIQLEPNPYYPGADQLKPVRFVFLPSMQMLRNEVLNGGIDVAISDFFDREEVRFLDADAESSALAVTYLPGATWEHVAFNLDVTLLQDIRVRRAIAQSIGRQQLIDKLFAGHTNPLDSWLLPEQWAAAPADQLTRYSYNPDEARRLLDEAGLSDSDGDGKRNLPDGSPLVLRLLTTEARGSALRSELAATIQEQLALVGIGVEVQKIDQAQFFSPDGPLYRRQFDLALFAWQATPDPGGRSLWSCAAVPSENNGWRGENFPGWCFRDADLAIRLATTSLNRDERIGSYLKQQQLFSQELPALPLFQRVTTLIAAPGIQGLSPDQQAPITWNLRTWKRE